MMYLKTCWEVAFVLSWNATSMGRAGETCGFLKIPPHTVCGRNVGTPFGAMTDGP